MSTESYDPKLFAAMAEAEDKHFWFVARNAALEVVLKSTLATISPDLPVLEVGCGTGNVLRALEKLCEGRQVIGMDIFSEGLTFARSRVACPLVQGDMSAPPFSTHFGLIGLFDVLEHLPDDRKVLRDLRAMLISGGKLVLTVPAHQYLWSYFDEASHHCRRYEERDLRAKLDECGFEVEYLTPIFAILLPLMRLQRGIQSSRKAGTLTDDLKIVPVVNDILKGLLKAELSTLRARERISDGTSLLAVVRAV